MKPYRTLIFLLLLLALPAHMAVAQSPPAHTSESPFDETITVSELFSKAHDAFGLEDLVLAELFYQEILRREPTNVQAMLELANVYERTGRLEYARGLLSRAAKLDPNNQQIVVRRDNVERMLQVVLREEIDELMAKGDYEMALPKLSLQIEISPNDAALLYLRSMCLSGLERYDAALEDLGDAIQMDPQERYYSFRSDIVERMQQLESSGMKAQVRELLEKGTAADREEALQLLGEILTAEPDDAWARGLFVELTDTSTTSNDVPANGSIVDRWTAASSVTLKRALRTAGAFADRHLALLLGFVALIVVFRSPLTRSLAGIFSRTPILTGQLDKFSLPEVLLMLNAEPHTGVLHIKGHACRGKVFFETGEPCHCVVGKIEGTEALNHLLDHSDTGRFAFSDGIMPVRRTIDAPLSLVLFEHARENGAAVAPGLEPTAEKKSRMKELLDSQRA